MGRKEEIFHFLQTTKESYSAQEVAEKFQLDRTNVSRYLNELYKEKKIEKGNGKPIKYRIPSILHNYPFRRLIGADGSLKVAVQQAQAAILYPPRGLHTLILGKTGTGKSLFAECMYEYAKDSKVIRENAPFITFNCADYSQNPQLLYGHIFGIKKVHLQERILIVLDCLKNVITEFYFWTKFTVFHMKVKKCCSHLLIKVSFAD